MTNSGFFLLLFVFLKTISCQNNFLSPGQLDGDTSQQGSAARMVGDAFPLKNELVIDDKFTISYELDLKSQTGTFTISFNSKHNYFGIWFEKKEGVYDFWLFRPDGQGAITVDDGYIVGNSEVYLDTNLGSTDDLTIYGYQNDTTSKIVKLKRALNTNDTSYDTAISPTVNNIILAYSADSPTLAHDQTSITTAQINLKRKKVLSSRIVQKVASTESLSLSKPSYANQVKIVKSSQNLKTFSCLALLAILLAFVL